MSLPTPQEERYYETLRQRRRDLYYKENNAAEEEPEIIFIGDSITELFPIKELLHTDSIMVNRGISASRSDHILNYLDCHVFGVHLKQIFLLIGVNDLGYGISKEVTVNNVSKIIDRILEDNPFIKISLLEILPVSSESRFEKTVGLRTNEDIQLLNQSYASLANGYFNVEIVSTFDAFLDEKGQLDSSFTVDGLHLTRAGYDCLANLIQPELC